MSVPRLIPVLLHKNGRLVLSRQFSLHQDIGVPQHTADRYKCWDLDELIFLDISSHTPAARSSFSDYLAVIRDISRNCFIPLSAGGGVCNLDQMHQLISAGADRIVINTAAHENPALIAQAAHTFGAQAVIVGIDVRGEKGRYDVYTHGGRHKAARSLQDLIKQAADDGAGEFFIHHIDRDGTRQGYDLALVDAVMKCTDMPLIVCGGAGSWGDMEPLLAKGVGGIAAANMFTYKELSYALVKNRLREKCPAMRPVTIGMDYAQSRRLRAQGSRLGAEKMILWQELDKTGLME